jgi:hypothetical protein
MQLVPLRQAAQQPGVHGGLHGDVHLQRAVDRGDGQAVAGDPVLAAAHRRGARDPLSRRPMGDESTVKH